MRAPCTYALLQESYRYLDDDMLKSDLLAVLYTPLTWNQGEGNLHTVGCAVARRLEDQGRLTTTQCTLQDAWGQLCHYCPDILGSLLGYQKGRVVQDVMAFTWAVGLPWWENPILMDEYVQDAYEHLERHGLDRFAPSVGREAGAYQASALLSASGKAAGALHTMAALQRTHEDVIGIEETDLTWKNLYGVQGVRRAAQSGWLSLLDSRVDPWEDFLQQSGTSPEDKESFEAVLEELRRVHQQRLADATRYLVAASTLGSARDRSWWKALRAVSEKRPQWYLLEMSVSLWDCFQEENEGILRLGELQDTDTPEVREIAQNLLDGATLGSFLLQEDKILTAARLLVKMNSEEREIAQVLLRDVPRDSDILENETLLHAATFLNS